MRRDASPHIQPNPDTGHRRDLSPPQWIVQLLSTEDRTIPWRDMIRAALSVGVPLSLGYAGGHLDYGVLITIGTLPGLLADRGGPLASRFRRALLGLLGGALGLFLGRVLVGSSWSGVAVIAVISVLAGLVSPVSADASFASLQLLVYVAIGSGFVLPMPAYEFPVLFLVGGAWAVLLTTAGVLLEGISQPESNAVAAVYRALGGLLEAVDGEHTVEARQAVTASLNSAYDAVVGARSRVHGRDRRLAWLGNMLNAAMHVAEAAVALGHAGIRAPQAEIDAIADLAGALSEGMPIAATPLAPEDQVPAVRALHVAVAEAYRRINARPLHDRSREEVRSRLGRTRTVVVETVTTRGNWAYALRVALCMTVAATAREVVPIERPYWILLTVAIVVKPDLGSVFARAVQRGIGTIVGVVVGALLLAVLPAGAPIILAIAVMAAFLPLAMRRNYGLLSIFITPLALVLIDLVTGSGSSILVTRLQATVLGCAIVLVLGYLLWPETWHARVGDRVSRSIDVLSAYLDRAFGDDEGERTERRRNAYRELSETRSALQRMLSEPPPFNRRAAAWWPVVNSLERVADAITEASVATRHTQQPVSPNDLSLLTRNLHDLRAGLGDGQPPRHAAEVPDGVLRGVGDEIESVWRVMHGVPGAEAVTSRSQA